MKTKTEPRTFPGWFGSNEQLLYVLGSVGADAGEDGKFKTYAEPIVAGLDGDVAVHGDCEYSVGGTRRSVAALMNSTSYGTGPVIIF